MFKPDSWRDSSHLDASSLTTCLLSKGIIIFPLGLDSATTNTRPLRIDFLSIEINGSNGNKKVLLRESKRHIGRAAQTSWSWAGRRGRVPLSCPGQGEVKVRRREGYPCPGWGGVPKTRIGSVPLPSPPPPENRHTPVKKITSRRTTYVGGKNFGNESFLLHLVIWCKRNPKFRPSNRRHAKRSM